MAEGGAIPPDVLTLKSKRCGIAPNWKPPQSPSTVEGVNQTKGTAKPREPQTELNLAAWLALTKNIYSLIPFM